MTMPEQVQTVLDQYFARMNKDLPGLLEAFYLFGSISLASFQEGVSDLDFAAVTYRPLTEQEVKVLERIHFDLEKSRPKISLDGRYIRKADLDSIEDQDCPYYYFNSGRLVGLERLSKNSVDAFQLKHYGMAIIGPSPQTFGYTIDWDVLTRNMKLNLEHYWRNWKRRAEKFPSLPYFGMFMKGWMIEWGVLGVSRIYYSIKERDLISKSGAGQYAMRHVPARWHLIIRESIRLREGNSKSLYLNVFKRRQDALAYMDYMIKECLNE